MRGIFIHEDVIGHQVEVGPGDPREDAGIEDAFRKVDRREMKPTGRSVFGGPRREKDRLRAGPRRVEGKVKDQTQSWAVQGNRGGGPPDSALAIGDLRVRSENERSGQPRLGTGIVDQKQRPRRRVHC